MIVKDNRSIPKYRIDSLNYGDVFDYEGDIYMMTKPLEGDNEYKCRILALSGEDAGRLFCVDSCKLVVKLNAVLVLN